MASRTIALTTSRSSGIVCDITGRYFCRTISWFPELPSSHANGLQFPFFFRRKRTSGRKKGFSRNESGENDKTGGFTTPVPFAGIPITGETETTDSTRGEFVLAKSRTPAAFFRQKKRVSPHLRIGSDMMI